MKIPPRLKPARTVTGIIFLTILLTGKTMLVGCHQARNKQHKIVIEGNVTADFPGRQQTNATGRLETLKIQYVPFHTINGSDEISVAQGKVQDGKVRWTIYSDKDLLLTPQFARTVLVHPGDSILINYTKDKVFYTGKRGEVDRFSLVNGLMEIGQELEKPTKNSLTISSLQDFLRWNQYVDSKLAMGMTLIERYKNRLSAQDIEYYKTQLVSSAESERVEAFGGLLSCNAKDSSVRLSSTSLNSIWDSTQYKPLARWLRSVSEYHGSIQDIYSFNRLEVQRKFSFDPENDSLSNKEMRTYLYYTSAANNYRGLMRERLMAYVLDEQTITEMGLKNTMTQMLLNDYYSQPGYPEYKQWVKEKEAKRKEREAAKDKEKATTL